MARALIIGPPQQTEIAAVIAYAMDHVYCDGDPIASQNPNFVITIPMGFRCIFTFTRGHWLWRHLSVSTPDNPGRMPGPEAMVMLAKEFGFTGCDPDLNLIKSCEQGDWMLAVDKEHDCIVVAQRV